MSTSKLKFIIREELYKLIKEAEGESPKPNPAQEKKAELVAKLQILSSKFPFVNQFDVEDLMFTGTKPQMEMVYNELKKMKVAQDFIPPYRSTESGNIWVINQKES